MRFSYHVDRYFKISLRATILTVVIGVIWVGTVLLISVAAVGYEDITLYGDATNFNASNFLWYDHLIPSSRRSRHRNCTAATISLSECNL